MPFLVSIIPGLSFTCCIFLLLIGVYQYGLYQKTGYLRSKSIAFFCLFASLFAAEPFVVHSDVFPKDLAHIWVMISAVGLCLSSAYYIQAINYFIIIPSWLTKWVQRAFYLLALLSFLSIPSFVLTSYSFFFDTGNYLDTDNYFVDTYSLNFGAPLLLGVTILSATSIINTLSAAYILRIVIKGSGDMFFIVGLLFTIIASTIENFLLPFTLEVFFPLIFLSNLFEAFRMNSLSLSEHIYEQATENLAGVESTPTSTEQDKYQNSNLDEKRIQSLSDKVIHAMEKDRLYLNPNLKAENLARAVGIPAYQLSQVINIGLNCNFFDITAYYRTEEVKRRLLSPEYQQENILSIAYDCGFNSKSSFNNAFKKFTGMTPSQFRRQHKSKPPHASQ
jgi:AraC-like DNA-binding protein